MASQGWLNPLGSILILLDSALVMLTSQAILLPFSSKLTSSKTYAIVIINVFFSILLSTLIIAGHLGFLSLAGLLILHSLAAVITFIVLRLICKKSILLIITELRREFAQLASRARQTPLFSNSDPLAKRFLYILIASLMLFYLALAIFTVPLFADSLSYRISRGALFLQNGSITNFDFFDDRLNYLAHNVDLLFSWIMAFAPKGMAFLHIIGWASGLLLLLVTHRLARELLPSSRYGPAIAVLLTLAVPSAVMEFVSSQTDIVAAAFLWSSLLLTITGLKGKSSFQLLTAGLAMGIAVGAKGTVFYFAPGLLLLALVYLLIERYPLKQLLTAAALLLTGTLLLGSQRYIMNLSEHGNFFSTKNEAERIHSPPLTSRADFALKNTVLYGYQLLWPQSNPPFLYDSMRGLMNDAHDSLSEWIGREPHSKRFITRWRAADIENDMTDIDENFVTFGLFQFCLFMAGGIWSILRMFSKDSRINEILLASLFLAAIVSLLFFFVTVSWTSHKFRYFTIFLPALVIPFASIFRCNSRALATCVSLLGVAFTCLSLHATTTGEETGLRPLINIHNSPVFSKIERIEQTVRSLGGTDKELQLLMSSAYNAPLAAFVRAGNETPAIRLISKLPQKLEAETIILDGSYKNLIHTADGFSNRAISFTDDFFVHESDAFGVKSDTTVVFGVNGVYADLWTARDFSFKLIKGEKADAAIQVRNPTPEPRTLYLHGGMTEIIRQVPANSEFITIAIPAISTGEVRASVVPAYHPENSARILGLQVRFPISTRAAFINDLEPAVQRIITSGNPAEICVYPFVHTPWRMMGNAENLFTWLGTGRERGIRFVVECRQKLHARIAIQGQIGRLYKEGRNKLVITVTGSSGEREYAANLEAVRGEISQQLLLDRGISIIYCSLYSETVPQPLNDVAQRPAAFRLQGIKINRIYNE